MEKIQAKDMKLTTPSFTESEIEEMENLFREVKEDCLGREFCEDLAASFSASTCRYGKPSVRWEQVQNWFHAKQNATNFKSCGSKDPLVSSDTNLSSNIAETSIVLKGGKASELSELAFEARSLRDNAWYDVASFLNFRILVTGDLEVRVRFAGFNNSHDEWVNAKMGVRERSIPLEASDCHRVKVGDLVLCFQERSEYAVYVDAHVIEIQRRLHDIKGCRCIFVVRYDNDKSEDKVPLERICRRP